MKTLEKVHSSNRVFDRLEVNVDTVYVRFNEEKWVEDDVQLGWIYDETQYNLRGYIESLTSNEDTQSIALLLSMLMSEVDFLRVRIESLEGGEIND